MFHKAPAERKYNTTSKKDVKSSFHVFFTMFFNRWRFIIKFALFQLKLFIKQVYLK